MRVRVKHTVSCPDGLDRQAIYIVYGIEGGWYRVVSRRGGPVLYECGLFTVLDPVVPSDWVTTEYEDGEVYEEPRETAGVGFYEDWHDGVPAALETFDRVRLRVDDWHARRLG